MDLFEKIAELIIMTASRTLMGTCNHEVITTVVHEIISTRF